jgi:hypothetical protein
MYGVLCLYYALTSFGFANVHTTFNINILLPRCPAPVRCRVGRGDGLGVLMSPLLTALRLVNLRAGSENLLRPRLRVQTTQNLGTMTSRSLRISSVRFLRLPPATFLGSSRVSMRLPSCRVPDPAPPIHSSGKPKSTGQLSVRLIWR